MCIYPVGWNWAEYQLVKYSKTYPWEKKAKKVRHFDAALNEPQVTEGSVALQNGAIARRDRIERLLMRMIKRKEIIVTIYDHRMQGYELGDKMRLDATFKLNVESGIVGFNELTNGDAWDCCVDTKSLLTTLENTRAWETKAGPFDWLKIERYVRDLYETHGVPTTQSSYVSLVNEWHGLLFEDDQIEPTRSTLNEMISKLHAEYSN